MTILRRWGVEGKDSDKQRDSDVEGTALPRIPHASGPLTVGDFCRTTFQRMGHERFEKDRLSLHHGASFSTSLLSRTITK